MTATATLYRRLRWAKDGPTSPKYQYAAEAYRVVRPAAAHVRRIRSEVVVLESAETGDWEVWTLAEFAMLFVACEEEVPAGVPQAEEVPLSEFW